MENILNQINELPVEQLRTLRSIIDMTADTRIKEAIKQVKVEKTGETFLLSYGERSIIVKHSKQGYDIYETTTSKTGKIVKGNLLKKDSSLNLYFIKELFRMNLSLINIA
jgi:hypothetical protein